MGALLEPAQATVEPLDLLAHLVEPVDRVTAVAAAALETKGTMAMVRAQATTMASATDQSLLTTPAQM